MGLVEVGVGVIPGGRRHARKCCCALADAQKAFELIGFAKVATSAAEARNFGLLRAAGPDLHESGAADRRRQGAGAVAWRQTTRQARRAPMSKVGGAKTSR